jgi:uncharacterized protein YbjT (DUF2867 family)
MELIDMTNEAQHAVTGAFGFSGKYIALRLLAEGKTVMTLTQSPNRPNPFGEQVKAFPYHFDAPEKLTASLRGVKVLYNTYWVRFNTQEATHADAVRNTLTLFSAAKAAGVERVVHVSITNPDEHSPIEYFRAKATLEHALKETGLSYAILRPASLFGDEDILINNIAWTLRRLPVFGIFGDGQYKIQPIHVDDLAQLAVEQGKARENRIIDAIGPETFTYRELVTAIAKAIGKKRLLLSVPPVIGFAVASLIGLLMRDRLMTREEMEALLTNCLYVSSPPAGTTRLTEWAAQRAPLLGLHYASELARRRDRRAPYSGRTT